MCCAHACLCTQLAEFCANAPRPLSVELHCHVSAATARDGEEDAYKEALLSELATRGGPPFTAMNPGSRSVSESRCLHWVYSTRGLWGLADG
jgi:hypothetical protein